MESKKRYASWRVYAVTAAACMASTLIWADMVRQGRADGMGVPRGLSYRARISLTDGTTTSPEVGYMWFGILYSDSGFEIRTPEESDFGTDYPA